MYSYPHSPLRQTSSPRATAYPASRPADRAAHGYANQANTNGPSVSGIAQKTDGTTPGGGGEHAVSTTPTCPASGPPRRATDAKNAASRTAAASPNPRPPSTATLSGS